MLLEARGKGEAHGGDEDEFAHAESSGGPDGEEAGDPGEGVGACDDVKFFEREFERLLDEEEDRERLEGEAEDCPEEQAEKFVTAEAFGDRRFAEAVEDSVGNSVEDFGVEDDAEQGRESHRNEEPGSGGGADVDFFRAGEEQARDGDEDVGEEEGGEFEDLAGGDDGAWDAIGFAEVDAADDLPDGAGEVPGEFGAGPDSDGGAVGELVAEAFEGLSPAKGAEGEEEDREHQACDEEAQGAGGQDAIAYRRFVPVEGDLAKHVEEDRDGDGDAGEAKEPWLEYFPERGEAPAVAGVELEDFVRGLSFARGEDRHAPAAEPGAHLSTDEREALEHEVEEVQAQAGDQPSDGDEEQRNEEEDQALWGIPADEFLDLVFVFGGDDPECDAGDDDGDEGGEGGVVRVLEVKSSAAEESRGEFPFAGEGDKREADEEDREPARARECDAERGGDEDQDPADDVAEDEPEIFGEELLDAPGDVFGLIIEHGRGRVARRLAGNIFWWLLQARDSSRRCCGLQF